jgi:hypothetical protein
MDNCTQSDHPPKKIKIIEQNSLTATNLMLKKHEYAQTLKD